MHRIRTSLSYYSMHGWEPEIITVDEKYIVGFRDEILNQTVPANLKIHYVKALPLKLTRKIGMGSLSLRSFFHFRKKGNEILKGKKFDLIFFSTTMFHVLALGPYWKRKFKVPFVVDLQDPWRNDFYILNPHIKRPPKFKMAYFINKLLEAKTMPFVNGIMAVSAGYIDTMRARYPTIKSVPASVIPFGAYKYDFEIVRKLAVKPEFITSTPDKINIVYVGAFPANSFLPILKAIFLAFREYMPNPERFHFYFIGTQYVPGQQVKPISQLAKELGMEKTVTEVPERISYFSSIATIQHSDILLIIGSIEAQYNASKMNNYLLAQRPIFSVVHAESPIKKVLDLVNSAVVVGLSNEVEFSSWIQVIGEKIEILGDEHFLRNIDESAEELVYSSEQAVMEQVALFDKAIASN